MSGKFFGNQDHEQIIGHLKNFLRDGVRYNLSIDGLGIHFEIKEAIQHERRMTNSELFKNELSGMSKKERKEFNLKRRRMRPKIRSVKKGRTVSLKGTFAY